ncbi:hypothetical protein [Streptomyces sp. NPDC002491]
MSELSTEELLGRIRAARDAAIRERETLQAAADTGDNPHLQMAQTLEALSYRVVIKVLDDILNPGSGS